MATRTTIFNLLSIASLLLLFPLCSCDDENLTVIKTLEDFQILRTHPGGSIVYFIGFEDKVDHKLVDNLKSAAEDLENYNVKVAYSQCQKDSKILHCLQESAVFAVSENDAQTLYIPSLHSEDAIVAHTLQFLMRFEIGFSQTDKDWDTIIQFSKAKTDIVLLFVRGLGDKIHRYFLETAFVYGTEYKFVITTSVGLKALDGQVDTVHIASPAKKFMSLLNPRTDHEQFQNFNCVFANSEAGIWFYFCKTTKESEETCEHQKFNGLPRNVISLANFIQFSGLPDVVAMRPNGTSLFDTVPLKFPMQRVICITNTREGGDHLAKRLKLVTKEAQSSVRFIIGNPNENSIDDIKKYGISRHMLLPHCVMESSSVANSDETHYEHLSSSGNPFVYKEILHFVMNLINRREEAFLATAQAVVPLLKWSRRDEMIPDHTKNIVMTMCTQTDPDCARFKVIVMRLARTFTLNNIDNVIFHYEDFTEDNTVERSTSDSQDMEALLESVRLIRIKQEGDDSKEQKKNEKDDEDEDANPDDDKFLLYHGNPNYESTLAFICDYFGIKDIEPVPLSGADYMFPDLFEQPNPLLGNMIDDSEPEEGEQEEEENLFKDQEDEVARDMFLKHKSINDSNVDSLTDKTFPKMIEKFDVFIVHFYLPWDSRCIAFFEPFAKVAEVINKENLPDHSTALYKVSCYDWPDVCKANNVTVYPEVVVFRKGSPRRLYMGPLAEEQFMKAVRLYQAPPVTVLTSDGELSLFTASKLPQPAAQFASVSILGLFNNEKEEEFETFKEVAFDLQGYYVFGSVSGQLATKWAKKYDVIMPAGIVLKHHSFGRTSVVSLTDSTLLKELIRVNSLPVFGRLTNYNLPEYRSVGHKLVILFVSDEQQENTTHYHGVKDLARLKEWEKISFVYMPMTDHLGESLKEEYLGVSGDVPSIVYVDHEVGLVYSFDHQITHVMLVNWVKECQAKKLKPVYTMEEGNWKPLKEGFDFIKLASQPSSRDEDYPPVTKPIPTPDVIRRGRKFAKKADSETIITAVRDEL